MLSWVVLYLLGSVLERIVPETIRFAKELDAIKPVDYILT